LGDIKNKLADKDVLSSVIIKKTTLNQNIYTIKEPIKEIVTPKPEIIKKLEPPKYLEFIQNVMVVYEKYFVNYKKNKDIFDTLLKKKFLEKVDKFDFLDPFTAEFKYSDGKITFTGKESEKVLAKSLVECLNEICSENKMKEWIKKHVVAIEEKYNREITELAVKIYN
jgi:hypothetical protein